MEKYVHIIPYFIFSCGIGVVASLIFGTDKEKITRLRIVREVFGSMWISAVAYFILKQFCNWSDELIYATCSVISFLNSKLINFIGKDLIEALTKGLLQKIKDLTSKSEE